MLFITTFDKFVDLRRPYVVESTVSRVYIPTRNSVVRILHDRELDDYSPMHLIDYTQILLRDHAAGGVNVKLRVLRTFGRWLIKKHLMATNAFAEIELLRQHQHAIRFLGPDEFKRILEHEANPNRRDIYLTLVMTGLRVSDILALTPGDIDTHRWLIRIVMQKTGREVLIPVHPILRQILEPRMQQERLFATPRSVGAVSHAFQTAARKAGVRAKLHDLRRTAGSWMVQASGDICAVSKILGHSSPTITARLYSGLLPESLRKVVDVVQDPRTTHH